VSNPGRWDKLETRACEPAWTFLTNHAAVLLYVYDNPDDTVLSIAMALQLRERAVAAILRDLREAGYVDVSHRGRRNHYSIDTSLPLRRVIHAGIEAGHLLAGLGGKNRAEDVRGYSGAGNSAIEIDRLLDVGAG